MENESLMAGKKKEIHTAEENSRNKNMAPEPVQEPLQENEIRRAATLTAGALQADRRLQIAAKMMEKGKKKGKLYAHLQHEAKMQEAFARFLGLEEENSDFSEMTVEIVDKQEEEDVSQMKKLLAHKRCFGIQDSYEMSMIKEGIQNYLWLKETKSMDEKSRALALYRARVELENCCSRYLSRKGNKNNTRSTLAGSILRIVHEKNQNVEEGKKSRDLLQGTSDTAWEDFLGSTSQKSLAIQQMLAELMELRREKVSADKEQCLEQRKKLALAYQNASLVLENTLDEGKIPSTKEGRKEYRIFMNLLNRLKFEYDFVTTVSDENVHAKTAKKAASWEERMMPTKEKAGVFSIGISNETEEWMQRLYEDKKAITSDSYEMKRVKKYIEDYKQLKKNLAMDPKEREAEMLSVVSRMTYALNAYYIRKGDANMERPGFRTAVSMKIEKLLTDYLDKKKDGFRKAASLDAKQVRERLAKAAGKKARRVWKMSEDLEEMKGRFVPNDKAGQKEDKEEMIREYKKLRKLIVRLQEGNAVGSIDIPDTKEGREEYELLSDYHNMLFLEEAALKKETLNGSEGMLWSEVFEQKQLVGNEMPRHKDKADDEVITSFFARHMGINCCKLYEERKQKKGNQISKVWLETKGEQQGFLSKADIVKLAKKEKTELIYSANVLEQLSSLQLMDILLGVRKRPEEDFAYKIDRDVFQGRDVYVIKEFTLVKQRPVMGADAKTDRKYKGLAGYQMPKVFNLASAEYIRNLDPDEVLEHMQESGVKLSEDAKQSFLLRAAYLKEQLKKDKSIRRYRSRLAKDGSRKKRRERLQGKLASGETDLIYVDADLLAEKNSFEDYQERLKRVHEEKNRRGIWGKDRAEEEKIKRKTDAGEIIVPNEKAAVQEGEKEEAELKKLNETDFSDCNSVRIGKQFKDEIISLVKEKVNISINKMEEMNADPQLIEEMKRLREQAVYYAGMNVSAVDLVADQRLLDQREDEYHRLAVADLELEKNMNMFERALEMASVKEELPEPGENMQISEQKQQAAVEEAKEEQEKKQAEKEKPEKEQAERKEYGYKAELLAEGDSLSLLDKQIEELKAKVLAWKKKKHEEKKVKQKEGNPGKEKTKEEKQKKEPESEEDKTMRLIETGIVKLWEHMQKLKTSKKLNGEVINATSFQFYGKNKDTDQYEKLKMRDVSDQPLFSHIPSIADVCQNNLGNCYFLATIASVVEQDPFKIVNMMKDNGKTVTVRLFDQQGSPHLVEVEKSVPELDVKWYGKDMRFDRYAKGALWVQMLEKAFVASGFVSEIKKFPEQLEKYNNLNPEEKEKIKDENLQQALTFEKYKSMPKEGEPGKMVTGRVYETIESGSPRNVFQLLTGEKGNVLKIEGDENIEDLEEVTADIIAKSEKEIEEKYKDKIDFAVAYIEKNCNAANPQKRVPTVAGTYTFVESKVGGMNGEHIRSGVVGPHAYTVLGTEMIGDKKMIKLSNPYGWGKVHYEKQKSSGVLVPHLGEADDVGVLYLSPARFVGSFCRLESMAN